jgi:acetyl esterase/lipase
MTANYSLRPKQNGGQLALGNAKEINGGPALADGESRKRICVIDAKSVIRWVKRNAEELGVDPDKLIVSGASAGAHISVLQMMDDKFNNPADPEGVDTEVQAFVLLAGAFTFPGQDKTPEVNVFQHVDKPFPPTLFICGETDRWASVARELAKQLNEKNGNDIEYWFAPKMGHMFFRSSADWSNATKLLMDHFLREHGLLNGESALKLADDTTPLLRIDL